MNNFSEHLQSDDEKMQELALQSGIRKLMNNDLRAEIESELADKYGVYRNQKKAAGITVMKLFMTVSSIAASILIMISLYWWLTPQNLNTLTATYLQEWYNHPGVTKGVTQNNSSTLRSQAISVYKAKDFSKAAQLFSQIDSTTNEDNFFHSLSLLYSGEYSLAAKKMEDMNGENQIYQQEINWYLAICYIKLQDNPKSIQALQKIKPEDWNYDKAQKLLKAIGR